MDGILALGHFCETHGPCVILCTQRCDGKPKQGPHSLTVPWCEACQSIDLQPALLSKDAKAQYITTRTPLQQDLAFLLKQATVRSLSCEEETNNKEGSVLYFGDNERGHVFSHTFSLQDALARGFHRRYCIIMLMRDKVHLLNSWPFLVKHIKEIANDLKVQAAQVNLLEQEKQSQRSVRQAQFSPSNSARCLSQLTNQPAVYAHLHLWFCWIFSTETTIERTISPIAFDPPKPSKLLRALFFDMGEDVFTTFAYCILTGHQVDCADKKVLDVFLTMLPSSWRYLDTKSKCKVYRDKGWKVKWDDAIPDKLPSVLTSFLKSFNDMSLPDSAMEYQISGKILHWKNAVKALSICTKFESALLQALNIKVCDISLVEYWLFNIMTDVEKYNSVISAINGILNNKM